MVFQLNCVNNNPSATAPPSPTPVEERENGDLPPPTDPGIQVGAERLDDYLDLLAGKRLALVVNQSSTLGANRVHLVDTLLSRGQQVKKIFALEHGFRGTADAGATITNGIDDRSGLPIVSLYGKTKEPDAAALSDIDLVIFDVQDVGARFYTYISSLHYVLQGAAKNNTPVLILDRPNPNGHYVDGPVLQPGFQSFVGMHPVPVVHGMTIGEYGQMINGSSWLDNGLQAELTVIPCANYRRNMPYDLPVAPSPNLPNQRSILLYPSLCFFEGTIVSVGRGTDTQFQVYGHPKIVSGSYQFTPRPGPGAAQPKLQGELCYGYNLTGLSPASIRATGRIDLRHLLRAYAELKGEHFFSRHDFFDLLAGSSTLREQIVAGNTEEEIRAGWQDDLAAFRVFRRPYLLYE